MSNRRDFMLTIGSAAAGALVGTSGSVQADGSQRILPWSGDSLQWSGTLAQGKTIRIQGARGSMRAIGSEDGAIHVDARRNGLASIPIEVVERDDGVIICAGQCRLDGRATSTQSDDAGVDFVIRVPAGVRFSGSTVDGDITVERLRAEVTVATINGRVNIQTAGFPAQVSTIDGDVVLEMPGGEGAQFHATKVSGTIDSDFPIPLNTGPLLPKGQPVFTGQTGPQVVNATIGNGGPELRVTTVNGSIRLRRR